MNPRVSRSSALASKATGFPIAKIAARLAVGYALDEIDNDITSVTPASFEPTIDYVVVKWPRFAFEKFPGTDGQPLHPHAVGGRGDGDRAHVQAGVRQGDALARARRDAAAARGHRRAEGAPARCRPTTASSCCSRPCAAASARQRSSGSRTSTPGSWPSWRRSRAGRTPRPGLVRSFKSVDTCAAEFAAATPYYYSGYERPGPDGRARHEVRRGERPSVVILGAGPNRIGQGIEFDYCCVHAAMTVRDLGPRRGDDQLQPRDGLHRLRHQRPPLLRAADARRTCSA